jgi:hypothetical protein
VTTVDGTADLNIHQQRISLDAAHGRARDHIDQGALRSDHRIVCWGIDNNAQAGTLLVVP